MASQKPSEIDRTKKTLRELDPLSGDLVRLMALFFEPTPRTDLARALAKLGRRVGNRAIAGPDILPLLQALQARGLVEGEPQFSLPGNVAHAATLCALEEGVFAAMAGAVRQVRPARESPAHSWASGAAAFRELRLALYAGQWKEASAALSAVGPSGLLHLCRPFGLPWIVALPADLRQTALRGFLSESSSTLEPVSEVLALLEAEPELDDKAHRVLVEQMVLRGRLDDADRLLADRTSIEADVSRALMRFLRGRKKEAIAAYEAALRAFLKLSGKKAGFFPDRAGAFFLVALLDEDRAPALARVKALAAAAPKGGSGLPDSNVALAEVAAIRSGDEDVEEALYVGKGYGCSKLDPMEVLLRVLAAGWVGAPVEPELAGELERRVLLAEKAGYAWFAGQGAEALLRTGATRSSGTDRASHLRKLGSALTGVKLAGLLARPEPWSGALDALLEVASVKVKPAKAEPERAAEHDRRLIWIVVEGHSWFKFEPREQVRSKGGFSKGRPVALKRLYEEAAKMDFLRDEDRAACRAIREKVSTSYYGRYRDISYSLDDEQAFVALVGSPSVFTEPSKKSDELVPAELRRGRVKLRAERSPEGLRLSLDPAPRNNEDLALIRRVGASSFEIVHFTAAHLAIAQALGKKGLVVPLAAEARVHEVLGALSSVVAVDTEIDAGAGVEAAPGDPKPRAILRPLGAGLSIELAVKPLGPRGPSARPGSGGTTMLAEIDGKRRRASRDLALEARLVDALIAACPALAAAEGTAAGVSLPDRERALEALVELHAQGDRVALEWPEGEVLRVSEEVTLERLRFAVGTDGDELTLKGALLLGGRRIELAELLGYLAATPGRFLTIEGDPAFLALHADLRRRLVELADLLGPINKKKGARVSALFAPLVSDLLTGAQLDADEAFRRRVADFAPRSGAAEIDVPATFRGELRPYQLDGFRWLARLARLGAGACLADDMGLGKTVQALALLVLRAPEGPSLVVAPTSVVPGWLDEAARFAPTLRPRLFSGEGRAAKLADLGPFDLVVTSYALLQQDVKLLGAVPWNVALLDEAQAIKNVETRRAQGASELRAEVRIAMTGTPVENRVEDLFGIFRFLSPALLGSAESFAARFVRPIERDGDAAARGRLRRIAGPFLLRRTKTDVLPELPARTEVTLRVALDVEEVALYEAIRSEALSSLGLGGGGAGAKAGQRLLQILAVLTRLRRAASHPRLVLPEARAEGTKLSALGELLDEILPGGHKVLIFSQFVDHLTLVRAFLDERKVSYQYLDGSTPAAKRSAAINAFQAGKSDAFLISLRAGGFGLNLTAADYVVHMDPWWNPAVEDQASDRAHRIGQTRPVTIYRLVARDTIEDQILALHHRKRELAESVLEGTGAGARMSEEELLDLVRGAGPLAREEAVVSSVPAATASPTRGSAPRSVRPRRRS